MVTNLHNIEWGIPKDAFPCWVISENERFKSLRENRPFHDYRPSCYFKPIHRLDNNFIQGHLGHISYNGGYHSEILNSYDYFVNYQNRKPVYFSFDRVTLYHLVEILPGSPLSFLLKRIDNPKATVQNRAFMIMPFKDETLNEFYRDHIRLFLEKESSIQIYRSDDFNGNDIIIETIYNQIEQAEFVIAEISHPNKNVFYELGWASAIGKEIITIQNQDIEQNIFFDRNYIRTRTYSIKNITEFQRQLKNDIIAIRQKILSCN